MRKYYEKQLNEGKNGELNELFERWISSYADKDAAKRLFCQDGLVVKYKDESTGYDVNKEWEKAERKIMFILKDCPDKWGYDARPMCGFSTMKGCGRSIRIWAFSMRSQRWMRR